MSTLKTRIILLFGVFFLYAAVSVSFGQRTSKRLVNNWEYVKGDIGGVYEALRTGKEALLPQWESVSLPHCFNALDAVDPDVAYYQGPGWYRTFLDAKSLPDTGRILLHFEGAGQKTQLFIGKKLIGKHVGGYDEFTFDITEALSEFNGENIPVVVRCDNSRDLEMIPSDLSDFNLYGGLYRHVNLVFVPNVSIKNVHVSTSIDLKYKKAVITVKPEFYNPLNINDEKQLRVKIYSPSGNEVACKTLKSEDASESGIEFMIKKPMLWSVDKPQLYTLSIVSETSQGKDQLVENFGVRNFEFVPHGPFLLNGERVFLRGTHRHEDHAGVAGAMTDELILKEMRMMKEMGVNFIRLGHYQQSPKVLKACDSLGILVWEEIPWCRGGLGGEVYKEQARRMLTNMINQHYNHPSIIIWGLGNENDWPGDFETFEEEQIRGFMSELNDLSHKLDPVRKTAIRRCDFCSDIIDVYSPSVWAGWYRGKYTDYTSVSKEWNSKVENFLHVEWGASNHAMRHSETPDKGLENISTGKGADERDGDFLLSGGDPRVSKDGDWSETYACNLIDWHLKEQEKMDWHVGTAYWPFKDFSTPLRPENPVPYVNQKGVIQRDFTKKEAFYVFQSYWTEEPMIRIYGHTWPVRWGADGEPKMIKVYSNCNEAELFLNGESLGKRVRNSENFPAAGLRWVAPFNIGENHIKVVGKKGRFTLTDEITQVYQVQNWDKPALLKIEEVSRNSNTIELEVKVYDKDGVFCPDARNQIRFSVAGNGKLIDNLGTSNGSRVIELYNGRARIRVNLTGDKAIVSATSNNLKSGFIEL